MSTELRIYIFFILNDNDKYEIFKNDGVIIHLLRGFRKKQFWKSS